MGYNSKYKGEEVEALLDKADSLNIQAVDTSETIDDVDTNTYVKYVAQTLTEEQKAQARENIGVVENVDLSGYATKEDLNGKQDKLVSGTNIKTINGTSILGSGNIAISGGEGGSGTVNWNDISDNPIKIRYVDIQKHGEGLVLSEYTDIHVPISFYEDSTMFLSHCNGLECNYDKLYWDINKIKFIPENANTIDGSIVWEIHNTGDGTKFLSDNGQYKEVYTKTEIDTKLGDINTILESIINS